MPRGARLDAPGTLHHVILRGIEKRKIVDVINDDNDRENFVRRMGEIAIDTGISIYAWALMTNHDHILLKSGETGCRHSCAVFFPAMRFPVTGDTNDTDIYSRTAINRSSVKKAPVLWNCRGTFI